MYSKLFALVALMSVHTGCVWYPYDDDGAWGGSGGEVRQPTNPGDVTFSWSFAGETCQQNPDIRQVVIDIPGEELQNDGVYPCTVSGYPGITLHDFVAGTYSFNIEAVGYGNERLFMGSGTFTVNGDVRVDLDLTPVGSPSSYAYLTWSFPENSDSDNPTCSQAGVQYVEVSFDRGAFQRYACTAGDALPGAQTPFMTPGAHTIELRATNASGYVFYRYSGFLQTFSGSPVSSDYALNWAVGGASVSWRLFDGNTAKTCSQAGVDTVKVNFQDEQGNFIYGTAGDAQPCNTSFVTYDYLKPGTYRVFMQATGPSGTFYLSSASNPQRVVVNAGSWPNSSTESALYRN